MPIYHCRAPSPPPPGFLSFLSLSLSSPPPPKILRQKPFFFACWSAFGSGFASTIPPVIGGAAAAFFVFLVLSLAPPPAPEVLAPEPLFLRLLVGFRVGLRLHNPAGDRRRGRRRGAARPLCSG